MRILVFYKQPRNLLTFNVDHIVKPVTRSRELNTDALSLLSVLVDYNCGNVKNARVENAGADESAPHQTAGLENATQANMDSQKSY